ncbi:MAG: hypothetical protein R3B06_02770 [Kofleriaceae bacterium]
MAAITVDATGPGRGPLRRAYAGARAAVVPAYGVGAIIGLAAGVPVILAAGAGAIVGLALGAAVGLARGG